jgi:hypothetical protein
VSAHEQAPNAPYPADESATAPRGRASGEAAAPSAVGADRQHPAKAARVESALSLALTALSLRDRNAPSDCRAALGRAIAERIDTFSAGAKLRGLGTALLAEMRAGLGPADQTIGGEADPYLRRWYLVRRKEDLNVYLHQFMRSDDPRAPHDHPWTSLSVMLEGQAREIVGRRGTLVREITAGDIVLRGPNLAHRIELIEGRPAWTLLITGPAVRSWGFWCDRRDRARV